MATNFKKRALVGTLLALPVLVWGCTKLPPSPVKRFDGMSWIPLANTSFLIPDKTWLKSYYRDYEGKVGGFVLHALAPNVLPWGEDTKNIMYPSNGIYTAQSPDVIEPNVQDITIYTDMSKTAKVSDTRIGCYSNYPNWCYRDILLTRIPSKYDSSGLRLFVELEKKPSFYESYEKQFGSAALARLKESVKTPNSHYYEYVEGNTIKYFVRCSVSKNYGVDESCYMSFLYNNQLEVTFYFNRSLLKDIVQIGRKIEQQLLMFETEGKLFSQRNSHGE